MQPGQPMGGPYFHKVQSASSEDGLTFTLDERVLLEHASVPASVVLPDGRIRIYYVDASKLPETANVAESQDGGRTFTPLGLVITNRTRSKALDPAIVRLPDGRWRLYYFACSRNPDEEGAHEIHAAISSDGVHFKEEQTVFAREGLVDPDVWWNGKEWLMFVFSGAERETIVARSQDGLKFDYVGPLGLRGWGTVAPIKLDDGRFRLYAFEQRTQRSIGSFVSADGLRWTHEPGTRLTVTEGKQITDPFVLRLKDGSWKMIFKMDEYRNRGFAPVGAQPPQQFGAPPRRAEFEGPWNHDLLVFESPDGKNFGESKLFVERGGVPCVIRDAQGRLCAVFQWFPSDRQDAFDKVAVIFSTDDGQTWTKPEPVRVKDLPENYQRPFDPTLVQLDDGRYRLYFTSHARGNGMPAIYSAIGSDGIHYAFEPGVRLADAGRQVVDCSVARLGKTWHIFAPVAAREGQGYHAVSINGLNFRRLDDVSVNTRGTWIGNAMVVGGKIHFFGSGRDLWHALSDDGSNWELVSGDTPRAGDPAVVQTASGKFLMIATGPTRADAKPRPFQKRDPVGPLRER